VAGSCEYGDEPAGSGTTEIVRYNEIQFSSWSTED
jgi:hypothetical protein